MKGTGNQQDYGMRIYDPRLGRFLSIDPLTKDYPWYTPYQFAGNTPIQAIDLDGAEPHYMIQLSPGYIESKIKNPHSSEVVHVVNGVIGNPLVQGIIGGLAAPGNMVSNMHAAGNAKDPVIQKQFENAAAMDAVDVMAGIAAGKLIKGIAASYADDIMPSEWKGAGDYSSLQQPKTVGPGLKTTPAQRQRILEANKKSNDGIIRSDESGKILDPPVQSKKGVPTNMNQAEVDHIIPKSRGGNNSNSNLRVISKEENLKKGSKP